MTIAKIVPFSRSLLPRRWLPRRWLLVVLLLVCAPLSAQSLPVSVDVSGKVASARIGPALAPIADLTLTFDDVDGLSASALGISAQFVGLGDPALLARLPGGALTQPEAAFPLLITVEPPIAGGLRFARTVRVEVHTHALEYSVGSAYRLFKAPLGGAFVDITDEIAPGSVRARGTTGGFSQFLVLADLRPTDAVVADKLARLRARVDAVPLAEQAPLDAALDDVETALAGADYATASAAVDVFRAQVAARAGSGIADTWRAARDLDNHAGELLAGAATLKFSIAYLRDYGP